jgi:hypothetical protein
MSFFQDFFGFLSGFFRFRVFFRFLLGFMFFRVSFRFFFGFQVHLWVKNETRTQTRFYAGRVRVWVRVQNPRVTQNPNPNRHPYWRESSTLCTCSTWRGGDHRGATSCAATPTTSASTTPSGRSMTPRTSTITTTGMTPSTRAGAKRSTASGTRRRRRSSRR